MDPRLTVITLGVADLETSLRFYRDELGWPTEGIVGTEFDGGDVAFFPLQYGVQLALYPKQQLAADANVDGSVSSAAEFSLGHNVASKIEVDTVLQKAATAGATITDPARDRAWGGYSGHFQDPDGTLTSFPLPLRSTTGEPVDLTRELLTTVQRPEVKPVSMLIDIHPDAGYCCSPSAPCGLDTDRLCRDRRTICLRR